MSQHALLAPSGAETWMNCAGSAAMQRGLPDTANEYSDEGTAAHLLGSTCLETGKETDEFLGQVILVGTAVDFDGAFFHGTQPAYFVERRRYTVDDEMAEQVGKYVARVRQYAEGADLMMPERRVKIGMFTGEEDAAGTSDAAVVHGSELQVHDLKYGMGVRVDAAKNKQLMTYALGVREELDFTYGPFDKVRLVIHQPRLDHLSEWDCTIAELDAFAEEVKAKAKVALTLFKLHEDGSPVDPATLSPSEDACRWCKAKATCPGLRAKVAELTSMDFDAVEATPAVPVVPAEFKAAFPRIGLVEDWCKAMRAYGEAQLFEHKNSSEIQEALGIKLVMGKKGNREYEDEEKAEAFLKGSMRLPIEERCNLKLKSPTQIEKVLKPTPKRLKRFLASVAIVQRDGQPSVALLSDTRDPWTPPDTSEDFSATTEEESLV